MASREEIKEGVREILVNNGVSNSRHIVRLIQEFEDSKGVVIAVEGELPENPYAIYGDSTLLWLHQIGQLLANVAHESQQDMLKAGYRLTIPLV